MAEKKRLVVGMSGASAPIARGSFETLGGPPLVAPPMPAFYTRPKTLDDLIDHGVGRMLDLFGIDAGTVKRWGERSGVERLRVPREAARVRVHPVSSAPDRVAAGPGASLERGRQERGG